MKQCLRFLLEIVHPFTRSLCYKCRILDRLCIFANQSYNVDKELRSWFRRCTAQIIASLLQSLAALLESHVLTVLVLGGSSYTDYLFNTSHCSITKPHLYSMWVLRRISQDSGNNTVCCNPFFLILLFNYSYMHSFVNVSSFTGVRHTSLMIKDVKIFLLFCVSD